MSDNTSSAILTFLFTDIEGSTALWEAFPEAMKPVLARHDALLRQAVSAHSGAIFKTTGDGCVAAFENAVDAFSASLAIQQSLQAESWPEIQPQAVRVRIGIHAGEAEQRLGDFFGPVLNRAARLMSVGHGGQVLVSNAAAELGRDFLPPGLSLVDLGEHRLKDLVRPEHIFQLAHPALADHFPPLKSLDSYPNNLPVQLTSFVGREKEMDDLRTSLAGARLVTLTGSGGTGKTRLSLQVAAELLPSFADGAWFLELAPLAEGQQIQSALAVILGLDQIPGVPLLDTITGFLRGKRLLLILDNCEHLIQDCGKLADHLLKACPQLKILASSREALGIAGEVSYRVPSLSLPEAEDLSPEQLKASEAVQLFMDRAAAANPRFVLAAENTPAVAQICRRLDGIPLALELAAARLKLFPAAQIASRLNDRFRLLTGGSRTALPRQQTLRALIDWSYDLLDEPERLLLRGLSVFSGGWSYEAVEALFSDLDVLSLLSQLVNKSLVVMEDTGGEARYNLLETIRQYARDKLIEAGEATSMRDRHLDYYMRLSEEASVELRGNQAIAWFERLNIEADNFRLALEWGIENRQEDALFLLGNLTFFWYFLSVDHRQIKQWLVGLLNWVEHLPAEALLSRRSRQILSRGYLTMGQLQMGLGDFPEGMAHIMKALPLERELDDPLVYCYAVSLLALIQAGVPIDISILQKYAEDAVGVARQKGDKRALLLAMPLLTYVYDRTGHPEQAEVMRREIRSNLILANHPMFLACFHSLGLEAQARGQLEETRLYYSEALKLGRRMKSRQMIIIFESELAHLDRLAGNLQAAKAAYVRLIVKWKEFGQFAAVAHQLECFAMIASAEGEFERSTRLFGAASTLRQNIGMDMLPEEHVHYQQSMDALRSQIEPASFDSAWAEGSSLDVDAAVHYAITPASDGLLSPSLPVSGREGGGG